MTEFRRAEEGAYLTCETCGKRGFYGFGHHYASDSDSYGSMAVIEEKYYWRCRTEGCDGKVVLIETYELSYREDSLGNDADEEEES